MWSSAQTAILYPCSISRPERRHGDELTQKSRYWTKNWHENGDRIYRSAGQEGGTAMSITAYKVEANGHDRTGRDFGYVNIMHRCGSRQPCLRPDPCEKMEVMWADESVYGPPCPRQQGGRLYHDMVNGAPGTAGCLPTGRSPGGCLIPSLD